MTCYYYRILCWDVLEGGLDLVAMMIMIRPVILLIAPLFKSHPRPHRHPAPPPQPRHSQPNNHEVNHTVARTHPGPLPI